MGSRFLYELEILAEFFSCDIRKMCSFPSLIICFNTVIGHTSVKPSMVIADFTYSFKKMKCN